MGNSEPQTKSNGSAAFEEELKKLQEVVARLESSDLTLEEALEQFKSGCEAYQRCSQILRDARSRIEILAKELRSEELVWEPFSFTPMGSNRNQITDQED
ncbi:MAG: exodeoxyribonuclease VII small subunit [Planctomycetes bacterium]|nr:exodeoxyribonuclease VII small subunit [Planctomycetota bacterium]